MQIANPMYDVVFRYLMEDPQSAKLILSAIVGERVSKLTFTPKEYSYQKEGIPSVLRMDFAATIHTKNGKKQVLIELQKDKYYLEVMRFRRYLGEQYSEPTNKVKIKTKRGKILAQGTPILVIYILGEKVTKEEIPVLSVQHQYYDVGKNKVCHFKYPFIEALIHNAIFVQTPYLPKYNQTELERLLHIFNQENMTKNRHILEIDESQFPEKYRAIIRRLMQAMSKKEMIAAMKREDEFLENIKHREEELAYSQELIEQEREKAAQANKKAEQERQKAEQERQKVAQANKKIEQERQRFNKSVLKMSELGISAEEIASSFDLSMEEVTEILKGKP